jgi:hypothetical protein
VKFIAPELPRLPNWQNLRQRENIRNDLKGWRSHMSVWQKNTRGQSEYIKIKEGPSWDGTGAGWTSKIRSHWLQPAP